MQKMLSILIVAQLLFLCGCSKSDYEKCMEMAKEEEMKCSLNGGGGPLGCGYERTVDEIICKTYKNK